MALQLDSEIQFVKGVGPRLASNFKRLGIENAKDLLLHIPRRYEDRRNLPAIRVLRPGMVVTVRGRVNQVESIPTRNRTARTKVTLSDGTGNITMTFFNQPWVAKKFREHEGEVLAYGTVKEGNSGLELSATDFELVGDEEKSQFFEAIVPIYPLTEGLQQSHVRKAMQAVLPLIDSLPERLPDELIRANHLMGIHEAIRTLHQCPTLESAERARERLAFDELLTIQLLVQMRRATTKQEPGIKFDFSNQEGGHLFGETKGTLSEEIRAILPFELTQAQKRVNAEILQDLQSGQPMNRLVQGDVGSGKTAVGACAMLACVRSGYQAAMMAPTEILAEQHAANLIRMFDRVGIHVQLLTGKMPAKAKRRAIEQIADGTARIVVGTHALIQETVEFANLGLVIIDEQHRFGVRQRLALRQKSSLAPHVLVMTATPIPRTLSMTIYGDLDVSIIDELPPGRKPIKTHWRRTGERPKVYEGVRELLSQGRQAYFVCPAIQESEKLQTQAAVDLHYRLSTQVYPEYQVELLHGQMKSAEKEAAMTRFRSGEAQVLAATVVIEVGVDVPNASVMVVEDANRFGLSQLHQIRGRVGRGEHQSFCILVADSSLPETKERLDVMVATNDGFKIAEADFRLRGPGDLLGTAQSGMLDLRAADLIRDYKILQQAREVATAVIRSDPNLNQEKHVRLRGLLAAIKQEDSWISVS